MLSIAQAADLRARFEDHAYTVDAVVAAIGESAHAALGRNQTVPAERALAGRDDPLATLVRLWLLQRPVPSAAVRSALGDLVAPLVRAGVVHVDDSEATALLDLRPYATEDGDFWVAADLTPGLDGRSAVMRPDFVLGVSAASGSLAQLTLREPVGRALDLGTGCGVQTLHLHRHAAEVVATDLNPRALELAELTLALNGVNADLRLGDLYAPVRDERFDLITTNPPYVISPPTRGARLTYREGDHGGDGLVEQVVRQGPDHLADGGTLQVLGNWVHPRGGDWAERIATWTAGLGCDVHVIQREVLDGCAYAELWLADAGLAGSPGYRQRYQEWLEYFDRLGIDAVGLGWIVLRRTGAAAPDVTVEDWPYAVEQPIAPALGARLAAVSADRRLGDADILAIHWVLAADVVEESYAAPGAGDPSRIVLRRQRGLRRAETVDTALAGVLGACDGELSLGTIVDSVAALLAVDPARLTAELLPRFRRFAVESFVAAG